MRLPFLPDPETVIDSAVTGWDLLFGPGVADLTPTPSSIIHEAPQCTVHRAPLPVAPPGARRPGAGAARAAAGRAGHLL